MDGQPRVGANNDRRWVLAIDTATDQAGIALFDGEQMFERTWPGSRQQTVTVLPEIESMLAQAAVKLREVGLVAVAIGPGSFTGLRVGLSIAKGIVLSESCAIVGIPTLNVSAQPFLQAGVRCVVVSPAGRGRVIWTTHHPDKGTGEERNSTFDAFMTEMNKYAGWLMVAELTLQQRRELEDSPVTLAPATTSFRRAGVLAEMARELWAHGDVDDPVLLEPTYLHGRPNPR